MAITVDAATENVRTGTTSPQTFSHGGAASGVKGVVLAIVHGASSTDHVSAASYGGVAMTRKQRNTDTANEPGAAEIWFLGHAVPQGTQTVSYTPGATTDDIHAVVITLLAASDLQVIDNDGINENVANPSVTLQYLGRHAMAFAALYGGGADGSAFTPNANCTTIHDHDLGAFYSEIIRQTTAGTSDFAIGGTSSTDDVAFAAVAVAEFPAIGVSTETDTALALGKVKLSATAVSTEADASINLAALKIRAVGLDTETDVALALGAVKIGVTGLSTEVDTAFALAYEPGEQGPGISLETDVAFNLTAVKVLACGRADETDTALALAALKIRACGTSAETDTALALTLVRNVGRSNETDTCLALTPVKVLPVGMSVEGQFAPGAVTERNMWSPFMKSGFS